MASGPISSWQMMGKQWKQWQALFWGAPKITADGDCSHKVKRCFLLGRKVMTNLDSILKRIDITANKGPSSQSYGFSGSHVWMWELDYKESWALRNWCFWSLVLEKTLESPLDSKEIQPVHPKGNQSWVFIRRTVVEVEIPILWPPDTKGWLFGKDSDAVKIEGRRRRGWWRMRWLDGIIDSIDMTNLSKLQELVKGSLMCCTRRSCRVRQNLVTEQEQQQKISWTLPEHYVLSLF